MDGGSRVFLNCGSTPRVPLDFQGETSLLLMGNKNVGIPSLTKQGNGPSSRVQAGNSGLLSSSDMDLGVPMEIPLGSQPSSLVEAWNSASLSRCKRVFRPPVELR